MAPCHAGGRCQNAKATESFDLRGTLTQAAQISIRTAEGDIVTLAATRQEARSMQASAWTTREGSGLATAYSATSSEMLAFSLHGDLNPEERADIVALAEDLTAIASSFFAGDFAQAMERATQLGDLGSLSSMSATFSQHSLQQTSLHSGQALGEIPQATARGAEGETSLQARWQKILHFLEQAKKEKVATGAAQVGAREEAALRMLARWQEALAKNPSLAPHIEPLTEKALDRAAAQEDPAVIAKGRQELHDAFRRQFSQWRQQERNGAERWRPRHV